MALEVNGKWFCKVVHIENGRTTTRRIHHIMVQSKDGRLHSLMKEKLPDTLTLHSGVPLRGAHMAEVLLSPEKAKGIPWNSDPKAWIGKRDAFYLVFGLFMSQVILALAEGLANALS